MKKNKKNKNSNIRIMIVCIAVIMVWRGVWDLCDLFLFPDNTILSNVVSIVVGILILYFDDKRIDELK